MNKALMIFVIVGSVLGTIGFLGSIGVASEAVFNYFISGGGWVNDSNTTTTNLIVNITGSAVYWDDSLVCTADNGLCAGSSGNTSFNQTLTDVLYYPYGTNPLGYLNTSSSDGTGGWTNTTTTTSTGLNVQVSGNTSIHAMVEPALKVTAQDNVAYTTPQAVLRLSTNTSSVANTMTGFGPKIVFESDTGGGTHKDLGYILFYNSYATASIGRHWTGMSIYLDNEYNSARYLNMERYSENTGKVALGHGSTVSGPYGVAINAQNYGTGGFIVSGANNDDYINGGGISIVGGGHTRAGSGINIGQTYLYNDGAASILVGNWLATSAANSITFGTGVVGATQMNNNVANSILFGQNNVKFVWFQPTTSYFNYDGGNIDTLIRGNASTNALFIKASTGNIGVGTAAPSQKLDVNGSVFINGNWSVPALDNASKIMSCGVYQNGTVVCS